MDEKDRLLLIYLQNGLPLTPQPFAVLSAKIGADSAEILVRIQRLKKEGNFGGIKAILDPRAFHYQSAWVAVRIGPERQAPDEAVLKDGSLAQFSPEELDSRTEVFWQHPGVIYGCEREHELNVWFFIAVPPDHDLELHVRCLEKIAGASRTLFLPARKVFKGTDLLSSLDGEAFPAMAERFEKRRIGQKRQAPAEAVPKDWPSAQAAGSPDLTAEEIGMIRKLQEPFPLTDEPYRKIAADLGITEDQVLERIKSVVKKGCFKRIGSFSKFATVLPSARTLVVWQIPEEKLERIGPEISGFREVLYADRRPAFPEFPYSLYTMIQAGTSAELEVSIRRIQDRIGKWPCRAMVTTREFKKGQMMYFPKELDVWWRESRHIAEAAFH